MPSIRPVLIVGTGDHAELAAALRARGLGPMFAADAEQAARLLRHFRVDALIGVGVTLDFLRRLRDRPPALVIGGPEEGAWEAGADGFADADQPVTSIAQLVTRIVSGERRVRLAASKQEGIA